MACIDDLSPEARAVVRRILRDMIYGNCDHFAPPSRVVWECNNVGLRIQEEHPLDEPRFVYPLDSKQFLRRALELGFTEAAEAAERKITPTPPDTASGD